MSNKVNKFILPDGAEFDLAGGGEKINVDAELKEYMIWTEGKVYECKRDTNFSPTEYAQAWSVR